MMSDEYRSLSFWHDSFPGSLEPRPSLAGEKQVDVAIVGAGYTGLWTAYYLKALDPAVRIAIVEAETAGFGASGRNGGWCLGSLAGMDFLLEDPETRDGAIRLQRALFETVDEVGDVCEREGIDCHWGKGGNVTVATSEVYRGQLRADCDYWSKLGFGEDAYRWLEPDECADHVRATPNYGGVFMAACAAMHPARLVRGLADVVVKRGVELYERSPALALEPRSVVTRGGRIRAETVIRATEAYTTNLRHQKRVLLPLHSMMVATEPLPEAVWKEIGFGDRETFGDLRRAVTYAQRTADDRIAFGSRGAYFYGSKVHDRFPTDMKDFRSVQDTLESLFPIVRDYEITHRWGGALGVPRDWRPSVGIDREAGFAWGGGYVGEGVAASNLAGRTLADLILKRETELVDLPLVSRQFPKWEPEPLRWIAATALRRIATSLDAYELSGRPTPRLRGAIFDALVRK